MVLYKIEEARKVVRKMILAMAFNEVEWVGRKSETYSNQVGREPTVMMDCYNSGILVGAF